LVCVAFEYVELLLLMWWHVGWHGLCVLVLTLP